MGHNKRKSRLLCFILFISISKIIKDENKIEQPSNMSFFYSIANV